MIGERLGDWIIEAEIGKNEMGTIYRAHAADSASTRAAIKWLTHPRAKTADFQKLFSAQIDLLQKLKHPHIVAVLGGGMQQDSPYYVMEWVEGVDFETLLRRGEKVSWQEVLAIAAQIVPALRHAHRRSVLHRDLKPSNLFRCDNGNYKLGDFGVTKFFGDALLTNADNVLGSAAYLSPEQAAGKPHTKRSDFYALGCLFYTLIVGRPPFQGNTVVELIHKHCFVLPERPAHFIRDLPEEIDRFVIKLLAKEPSQRPGSSTLLIQEIAAIWHSLERRGLIARRPAAPVISDEGNDLPIEEDAGLPSRSVEQIPYDSPPWNRRWYIVVPAFSACVLLLLWAFFWRVPSADELMSRARPLLESENPADWDKAWSDYLEPLSRKYPDRFQDEVKEAKRRIDVQGDLRRAFVTGKSVHPRSEAERFYNEGLRLVQAGEFATARRVWDNLIRAYERIESEKQWVVLARAGKQRIEQQEGMPPRPSTNHDFAQLIQPAVEEVKRLRNEGKTKEAEVMSQALIFLYRDDPDISTLLKLLAPMPD